METCRHIFVKKNQILPLLEFFTQEENRLRKERN